MLQFFGDTHLVNINKIISVFTHNWTKLPPILSYQGEFQCKLTNLKSPFKIPHTFAFFISSFFHFFNFIVYNHLWRGKHWSNFLCFLTLISVFEYTIVKCITLQHRPEPRVLTIGILSTEGIDCLIISVNSCNFHILFFCVIDISNLMIAPPKKA